MTRILLSLVVLSIHGSAQSGSSLDYEHHLSLFFELGA